MARPASPVVGTVEGGNGAEKLITPRTETVLKDALQVDGTRAKAGINAAILPYRGPQLNFAHVAEAVEAIALGLQAEKATAAIVILSSEQRVAAERLLQLGAVAAAVDTKIARQVIKMAAHGFAHNIISGRTAGGAIDESPSAAAFGIATLATAIMGSGNMSLEPKQFDENADAAFRKHVVKPGTTTHVTGVDDPDLLASDCFG